MKANNHKVCVNCVMDESDIDITFDDNGYCNYCLSFPLIEHYVFPDKNSRIKLDQLISEVMIAGKGREYDCVVGISGGADSSYLCFWLKKNFPELRILAVHVDAGWNSELATANIEKLINFFKIDLFTKVINWDEMRDIQLAFLKSQLANQDTPQDHIIFSTINKIARQKKIKYILSGANFSTESILPESWGYDAMDARLLKSVHHRFGQNKLREYSPYTLFDFFWDRLIVKIKTIRPLDFIRYDKKSAINEMDKEFGWKDYGEKHYESKFTRFFQGYWLPRKFGFDKRLAHFSSLILSKQLTRDQALLKLKRNDYASFQDDIVFIAKKLRLSNEDFIKLLNAAPKNFSDYPNNQTLIKICHKALSAIEKIVGKL